MPREAISPAGGGTAWWGDGVSPSSGGDSMYMYLNSREMPQNGWISGVAVYASLEQDQNLFTNVNARVVLYRGEELVSQAAVGINRQWAYRTMGGLAARYAAGQGVRWGLFRISPYHAEQEIMSIFQEGGQGQKNDLFAFEKRAKPDLPPNNHGVASEIYNATQMAAYFDYTANASPTAGAFTSPAAGAISSSTSLAFAMSTPHNGGDGAYDYTDRVQLRLFDAATNLEIHNQTYATSQTQKNANNFSISISGLESGKSYYADFRHQDSWGVWSAFSTTRSFTIAQVPDAPTLLTPSVKLDQRSGYEYRKTHNHPEGRPIKAVEVELYNAAGTTRLWTSGVRTLPSQVSAGATFGTPASGGTSAHPTLAWGTGYSWRARVQDTLDAWSNWQIRTAFATNSVPTAPTNLVPADGARTGNRNFTATVSDPDGDQVMAAEIEFVRVSTGATASGYPRAMAVEGNRASFIVPESDLVAGENYRWRARATDGLDSGYGPWSAYNQFLWAVAPTVSLLNPSQFGRVNMVARPSAEYDPEAVGEPWWQISNTSETNFIERARLGEEAAHGEWAWRAVVADPEGPIPTFESPPLPVDEAERHLAQVEMKRVLPELGENESLPAIESRFEIECFDASEASLGVVSPFSLTGEPVGSDLPGYWSRYGGAIWPSDETGTVFPAGTESVRIRLVPLSSGTGEVLFDAFSFEEMPDSADGRHFSDSSFFGYADPSTDGYGGETGVWLGEEGNSESNVIAVLQDPATNHMMYSYSHPTGLAMNATRVIVQRMQPGVGWRPHHDSGYLAPASTPTVSLPDYLFRNETRYRAKVVCRDAQAIDGESEWVEFIARFVGPPELEVFSYTSDSSRATITLSFESTGLDEQEFGGIEIARSAEGEPMRVVEVIRDAGASQHTYHFPVSQKPYRFYVRQVKLVGPERIEGRWRTVDASVDLGSFNFLKNANDPTEYVVFQHTSGAGPAVSREAPGEGYTPWGAVSAVHLFAESRPRSDTTSFLLFAHHPQSPAERLRTLKWWEESRPPLCLITRLPEPEKTFAALAGAVRFTNEGRIPRVEFEWQRTSFLESAYDAEGAVEDAVASELGRAL